MQTFISSGRNYGPDVSFWAGKRVFVTGHTGFKGSWLIYWLKLLGAKIHGYSLPPPTSPSLFEALALADLCEHEIGDIRDAAKLREAMRRFRPEIVLHLAAQPLVIASYDLPAETFMTNVQGTVHVLEACREVSPRAVVIVTTDKCYLNHGRRAYVEDEPLGGDDPYSASKACAEQAVRAWRNSYFPESGETVLASARAGNIFGGGDWGDNRLIPDAVKAFAAGRFLAVRNPTAIRPWQHVTAPLCGYLLLVEHMFKGGHSFALPFNFGPGEADPVDVRQLVSMFAEAWGANAHYEEQPGDSAPHESPYLSLDSTRARERLGWRPAAKLQEDLEETAEWYKLFYSSASAEKLRQACQLLIEREMHASSLPEDAENFLAARSKTGT